MFTTKIKIINIVESAGYCGTAREGGAGESPDTAESAVALLPQIIVSRPLSEFEPCPTIPAAGDGPLPVVGLGYLGDDS
jgi:hypothetical protein